MATVTYKHHMHAKHMLKPQEQTCTIK